MTLARLAVGLAAGLSPAMAAVWVFVLRTGLSGWTDAVWSLATGAACVAAALAPVGDTPPTPRQVAVGAMAAIWSLRLGLHIARRNLKTGGADPRYAWLRAAWGARYPRRLLLFLEIQAACGLLLAVSVMGAARNPAPGWRVADGLGGLLLIAAVMGEAVADRQLAQFRADPANRGRVCDTGLWGLSRHPNYFFEWLGWIAYPVIAIDPLGGYHWGWVALLGPALMYWLLVHASGIPPLEAHMSRSRGVAFRAYQERVNAFWPGPPRAGPGETAR